MFALGVSEEWFQGRGEAYGANYFAGLVNYGYRLHERHVGGSGSTDLFWKVVLSVSLEIAVW